MARAGLEVTRVEPYLAAEVLAVQDLLYCWSAPDFVAKRLAGRWLWSEATGSLQRAIFGPAFAALATGGRGSGGYVLIEARAAEVRR
jgi:hypothetical protein